MASRTSGSVNRNLICQFPRWRFFVARILSGSGGLVGSLSCFLHGNITGRVDVQEVEGPCLQGVSAVRAARRHGRRVDGQHAEEDVGLDVIGRMDMDPEVTLRVPERARHLREALVRFHRRRPNGVGVQAGADHAQ